MPNTFKRVRARAFLRQNGRCIYCDEPMWLLDPLHFAAEHKITAKQARRFQCTAEHLCARKNGGGDMAANIAAACRFCNLHRHIRKAELTPEQFRVHVRRRIERGGWHSCSIDADEPNRRVLTARFQPPVDASHPQSSCSTTVPGNYSAPPWPKG